MTSSPKPHRPYKLEEYNPDWVQIYKKKAEKLKSIFGSEAVSIHHIGSTSIPGMVAKPQVDILVVVQNLANVKSYYGAMKAHGFTAMPPRYIADDDEYFTENAPDGTRLVSVHTLEVGNPKIEMYFNFQNYLRDNKADRDLYIATKKALYKEHNGSMDSYYSGKKHVIKEILARANKWANNRV